MLFIHDHEKGHFGRDHVQETEATAPANLDHLPIALNTRELHQSEPHFNARFSSISSPSHVNLHIEYSFQTLSQ
jgi:hypothetical protein